VDIEVTSQMTAMRSGARLSFRSGEFAMTGRPKGAGVGQEIKAEYVTVKVMQQLFQMTNNRSRTE